MKREQFFIEIFHLIGGKYRQLLLGLLIASVLIRFVNTEAMLHISVLILVPAVPAIIVVVFGQFEWVLKLHEHFYKGSEVYKVPSIFSFKLFPYNIVVPFSVVVPPFTVVNMFFGFESEMYEHTLILSFLLLIHSLTVWYFWVFSPFMKRFSSNGGKL